MAGLLDPSAPYNMTGESLEKLLIQKIFGDGTLGSMIAQYGTPWINRMLGLEGGGHRSVLLDTTIFSNMTPYGIYMDNISNQINRVASDALSRQNTRAKRQWLEGINRQLTSFDSWRAEQEKNKVQFASDEQAQRAYNAWIRNKASGDMTNPFWSMGYSFMDPAGLNEASEYLQEAGANQIRFGRMRGSRIAMAQARAIGNLFMGPAGNVSFDRSQYGYMNVSGASAVAAALTRDIDFFAGKPDNAKGLRQATKELRDKVRSYTEALGPLKDVFGTDVPGMIKAIEDLSGKKFSSLSSTRVKDITRNILANAAVGGYTIGELATTSSLIRSNMSQMDVPFYNQLSATSQAMTLLGAISYGYTPAFMTDERYRDAVGQWVQRTSNSNGAGYINAAAAIWLDRNKGKTFADFEAAYNDMRNRYGETDAMMQLTGQGNLYAIEAAGKRSRYYKDALEQDIGGRISRQEQLDKLISYGWMNSTNRAAYSRAAEFAKKHPELLSDMEKLDNYRGSDLTEEMRGELRFIATGAGLQGELGEALVAGFTERAEAARKAPLLRRQKALQDQLRVLRGVDIPEDLTDLVNKLVSSDYSLSKLMSQTTKIAIKDPDIKRTMDLIGRAAETNARRIYGTTTSADAKEFIGRSITHGFLNGSTNLLYMEALDRFEKASGNPIVQADAAADLEVLSQIGESRISEVFGDKTTQGLRDIRRFRTAQEQKYLKEDPTLTKQQLNKLTIEDAEDYLVARSLSSSLDSAGYGSFIDRVKKEAEEKGSMSIDVVKDIATKMGKEANWSKAEMEEVTSAINAAFGGDGNTDTQLQDFMGKIGELLTSLSDLSGNLGKVITDKGLQIVWPVGWGSNPSNSGNNGGGN